MLTPELHPWQEGPVGLLRFARNTSRSADQLHQLIAFLILDICVETTMRTFLSLPDDIAPAKIKYFERRKFSEGTFHHLTRGLEAAMRHTARADRPAASRQVLPRQTQSAVPPRGWNNRRSRRRGALHEGRSFVAPPVAWR